MRKPDDQVVAEAQAVLDAVRARADERPWNKVALIQPRKGGRPSLGLLYVARYLVDVGFEVKVFEYLDELYPPNIRYNEKIWRELKEFDPGCVGFSVLSSTLHIVKGYAARIAKEMPGVPIIGGGKHVTVCPEEVIDAGADYCIVGEGEISNTELVDKLCFGESVDDVIGITYRNGDGEMVNTGMRDLLPMDFIERPAFELVDYKKYVDFRFQGIPGHYLKTGFVFSSRGCPFQCAFCTTHLRNSYRERSVDELLDEMQWQMDEFDAEAFVILDDLFYFKKKRVMEFCEKVKARGMDFKFSCHSRVDIADEEVLQALKDVGLTLLMVGVESGSQKILDAMNKGTNIPMIEESFRVYNKVGINTLAFIIVGHPDEDEEDRKLTRTLLHRIKATNVAVSFYMPMPGTKSFEFDIKNAKYVIGGDNFKGFSFTTDYPEFSTTVPLEELNEIGKEFTGLSTVDRNMNLFTYSDFPKDMIKMSLMHPLALIEGFWNRYVTKQTQQMGVMSVVKDAIQFQKQKF